jgi:ribosomal protein L11 methyltransferase
MGGMYLELSFDLGSLDPQAAEEAAFACGACAVTFIDARDDPLLEPASGELRLWPATRVKCLFTPEGDRPPLPGALGASLGVDPALIDVQRIAERAWEREAAYVTDTYAACFDVTRFGDRDGWVCLAGRRR